jgi:DNA invertase Pin-like site-specific DNA recombinase
LTIIGYARVSTQDQTTALQLDALEAVGVDKLFIDHGVSGAATSRPQLDLCLAALESGDTLVTWRLDRLGRSLSHLTSVVQELGDRGVAFRSLTENIETESASGRLTFHVFASLAQFERELTRERTTAGLAAARARGQKLGRPAALTPDQIRHAALLVSGGVSAGEVARSLNVGKSTLYRALRGRAAAA